MTVVAAPAESWLQIDPAETAQTIELSVEKIVHSKLRRKGVVVGLSGGIDSSVVAALCARSNAFQRAPACELMRMPAV